MPSSVFNAPNSAVSSPSDDEHWPISRLLTWTKDYFGKRGIASPLLEAELLLGHVLGYERYQLYMHYAEDVGSVAREQFRNLIKRRAAGEPVAYLIGKKDFYMLSLRVSPAVLIPRPETELVVDEFLDSAKGLSEPKVADIGTGSGCIALACAKGHPTAKVWATDVSEDALAVARANAQTAKLDDRVEFRGGSLLEPIQDIAPFDFILSNPPYIPSPTIATLERDVRDFEPKLALDGGLDGLDILRQLTRQAADALRSGGVLVMEIGFDQEDAVRGLLSDEAVWEVGPVIRDAAKHPRVIRAVRK